MKKVVISVLIYFACIISHAQNFLWANGIGGSLTDEVKSIAVDIHGNVFTAGSYVGTADFNPGSDFYYLTSD